MTSNKKLQVGGESNSGVIAITEIPTGARSAPFELSSISKKVSKHENLLSSKPLHVGIWQNGEIGPLGNGQMSITSFWPKVIKIAPDCHVQNVRICRWEGDSVILQATRSILTGQNLYLWFGEDLLVNDLEIPPYLSPSNIRGGNSYICNKCSKEFEAPNLLKIHLATECGLLSMDILWERLTRRNIASKIETSVTSLCTSTLSNFLSAFPLNIAPSTTIFLPPHIIPSVPTSISNKNNNIDTSSSNPILVPPRRFHNHHHHRRHVDPLISHHPQQHPCNNMNNNNNNNNNNMSNTNNNDNNSGRFSPTPIDPLRNGSDKDEQAHLESIVSNMGKAKNGHVCLYCGKLYSRKYGLKIHIRTHTGYKPLKCRICYRPFGDPSNLNKHVRLHSEGSTPYRCEFCGKILVRRRDLDRHIRSRHSHINRDTIEETNNNNNNNSIPSSTLNSRCHQHRHQRNKHNNSTSNSTVTSASNVN